MQQQHSAETYHRHLIGGSMHGYGYYLLLYDDCRRDHKVITAIKNQEHVRVLHILAVLLFILFFPCHIFSAEAVGKFKTVFAVSLIYFPIP